MTGALSPACLDSIPQGKIFLPRSLSQTIIDCMITLDNELLQ